MKIRYILLNVLILVAMPLFIGWWGASVIMGDFGLSMFIVLIGLFTCFTLHKIIFRDFHGVSHTDDSSLNEDIDIDDLDV